MNLVWHIIKKDLRKHAWAYGLWIVLLLAKTVVLALGFSDWAVDGAWFEQLQIGDTVLSVVESAVVFLLVGSFVLEDPLVGSSAFWPTRPISGRRLLAAKAGGAVGLFVLVPFLLALPLWLGGGLGGMGLARQAAYFLVVQITLVGVALVIAALSDRGNRFLVVVLALVVVAAITVPLLPKLFTVYPETRALATTRATLGTGLWVVAVVGAIWLQFTRRRLALSALWLVAGCLLGVVAWHQFPLELFPGWQRMPPQLAEAGAVTLEVSHARPAEAPSSGKTPEGYRWVELVCLVQNLPAGLRISSASYGRFVFTAPDGRTHAFERGLGQSQGRLAEQVRGALGVGAYVFADDGETKVASERIMHAARERRRGIIDQQLTERKITPEEAEARMRDLERVRDRNEEKKPTLTARILVPEWVAAGLKAEALDVDAWVDIRFSRLQLKGELPVAAVESFRGQGFLARIVQGVRKRTQEEQHLELAVASVRGVVEPKLQFCLLNRGLGYVSELRGESGYNRPPAFAVARTSMGYGLPRVNRGGKWVVAPGADDGLTLAVFTFDDVGLARRSARRTQVPWSETKP